MLYNYGENDANREGGQTGEPNAETPQPEITGGIPAEEARAGGRAETVEAFDYETAKIDAEEAESGRIKNWCEAAYSAVPEHNPEMYTPGINPHPYMNRPRHRMGNPPGGPFGENERVMEERAKRLRKRHRRGMILRGISLALVCVLLSGAASYGVLEYRIRRGDITPVNQVVLGSTQTTRPKQSDPTAPLTSAGGLMTGQEIYDMACTQVVSVKTDVPGMGGLFGQQSTVNTVSGSGFLISDDGYILTNHHVIESAYKGSLPLKVVLNDGTEYEASIIGFEESNDVAVIKIPAVGLSAAAIGNSDDIRVGQTVYAVGNPFGELVYTMTDGIVSGLNRIVSVEDKSISTFQINAAVNSGNSGGPVYNDAGEVIGIVTAKFMRNSVEGIGFAIPINDAINLAMDLVENGYITGKAFIGVVPETFTKAFAEFYSTVEGAYVVSITPGSAAEKAGIKVGDIITKLGDMEVTSRETLLLAKQKFKAGDTTTIVVRRSGEDLELPITFDEDTTWLDQQQNEKANEQPVRP